MQPRYVTVEELESELGYPIKIIKRRTATISDVPAGELFEIYGQSFVKLQDGFAITRNIIEMSKFGDSTNNYKDGKIIHSTVFDEFLKRLCGYHHYRRDSLIEMFEIDLTSDNGYDEYGIATDNLMGLMTLSQFQQNARLLQPYNTKAWWLSTPHGTLSTETFNNACYVSNMGMVEHASIREILGLRPVLKFKPNVEVIYFDRS